MTDIREILNEREKTHGDYTVHAHITQSIKSIIVQSPSYNDLSDHQRETLDMIALKIGRICAGNPDVKDHWWDIAGYATLSADRCPDAVPDLEDPNVTWGVPPRE